MKKLVAIGPKQTELIDVDMPVIEQDNHVIVKVTYGGVCRSEHYEWETAKEGMSFGHEPVGIVHEVGKAVTNVKVGDRVSGLFGGNTEYALSLDNCLFKIPDNVSDAEAILEPLSCLFSAVSKVRIPVIGDKVAVVGCGYMGCGAISLLAMRGAYVVAVDVNRASLENAKKYGAAEVYTPDELPAEYVTVSTDHNDHLSVPQNERGFKLVMEWAETEESLDLAINMTAMCGQLAIGAYHNNNMGKRNVNVEQLNVKAIDMLHTHPREWDFNLECCKNAMRLLAEDKWIYKHVPTKVYPVSQFDKAHEELTSKYGKYMKAMVDWSGEEFEPYIID